MPREIFEREEGRWYYVIVGYSGVVLATSPDYPSRQAAIEAWHQLISVVNTAHQTELLHGEDAA